MVEQSESSHGRGADTVSRITPGSWWDAAEMAWIEGCGGGRTKRLRLLAISAIAEILSHRSQKAVR